MQALRRRVMAKRAAAARLPARRRRPAVRRSRCGAACAVKAEPRKQDRPAGTAPTPAARPMKATGGGTAAAVAQAAIEAR